MIRCAARRYTATTGSVASIAAASSGPGLAASVLVNKVSPIWTVVCRGLGAASIGQRYSFQVLMNDMIATAPNAGRSSGSTMCHRIRSEPAPST